MRRASILSVAVLVAGALLAAPRAGLAQEPDEEADRQEMLERIQSYYQERLARELQVEPEQRPEFFAVISEFDDARGELIPRRIQLTGDVRRHLREGGSEDEARALIAAFRELRREELELQAREEDRLLEIIRPTQVLRLQVLREEFRNEIRRLQDGNPPNIPPQRRRGLRDWFPGFRR